MPETLDLIIGLATIMLVFSMAATVLTSALIGLVGLRGTCLLVGIQQLLRQIWPALGLSDARTLARKLLTHPMIGVDGRQGTVIQRAELYFLLLEFAAGESPDPLEPQLRDTLNQLLASSGVQDAAALLSDTRDLMHQLEAARPELAVNERSSMAILATSGTAFISKLFGWFDQTIDRVSESFTTRTRILSVLAAVLISGTFQLDSVWIIQRLNSDPAFRQKVVAQSAAVEQTASRLLPACAAIKPGEPPSESCKAQDLQASNDSFAALGLIQTPFGDGLPAWLERWKHFHLWVGCALSTLLLTLGAPFWYGLLQNALKLKSTLASKDDEERGQRQAADAGSGTPAVLATPVFDLVGERGDPGAIG